MNIFNNTGLNYNKITMYKIKDAIRHTAAPSSETGSHPKNKNNPSDERHILNAQRSLASHFSAMLKRAKSHMKLTCSWYTFSVLSIILTFVVIHLI